MPAPLSVALPILQGAADEDRDDLVDLWARLLANAMDPTLNNVRYSFIEAVKEMDPPDAIIMRYAYQDNIENIHTGELNNPPINSAGHLNIAQAAGCNADEVEVSLRHLEKLRFFDVFPGGNIIWRTNATWREFMRACYPEINPK